MKCSVLGCRGFIGSRLVDHLEGQGHEVSGFGRGDSIPTDRNLGHVFYAVGMTGDFRKEWAGTVEAHVSLVSGLLPSIRFESFTYFSSTRVYQNSLSGDEDASLAVNPNETGDIYNLSKLTGEALCMAQAHPGVRAVRISNVIDPGFTSPTFLSMIVREAIRNGSVTIGTSACSAKDYLPVSRLLPMLELVATRGTSRLYNLASGQAVSNALIAKLVHEVFGCPVTFAGDAVDVRFPAISTSRFRSEFGGKSVHLETELRQAMQNLKLSINE